MDDHPAPDAPDGPERPERQPRSDSSPSSDNQPGTDSSPERSRDHGGRRRVGSAGRPWYDDVVVSTLLRGALRSYGAATREALADVGCDDLPRNGTYVLGAIVRTRFPLSAIIRELGMSKQAAGQLVDTLVLRGYLVRAPDPDDRRRMTVNLTDRGRLAADAAHGAVEELDAALTERVGATHLATTRETLAALVELGAD